MAEDPRLSHKDMSQYDLVKHHYSRRAVWGDDAVLYRRRHPMECGEIRGNYQNWEIGTRDLLPEDAQAPTAAAARLFYSEDLDISLSRRRESMPYFERNCDADEVHLVSRGSFVYQTDFGDIEVGERDILVIPKGVTYRALLLKPQETLRVIFASHPEVFIVPMEMVEDIYLRGLGPLPAERLKRPVLRASSDDAGPFEVRVTYNGAFSDFLGETTTLTYDFDPLDAEIIDGCQSVFKFNVADIEPLGVTPIPFIGGRYLDNEGNLAWTLHLFRGPGSGRESMAPCHRNPDVDELRYQSSGPMMGNFLLTPQGVDHGAGVGYTRKERNRPAGPYDEGDTVGAYTIKALKGTPLAYRLAKPGLV